VGTRPPIQMHVTALLTAVAASILTQADPPTAPGSDRWSAVADGSPAPVFSGIFPHLASFNTSGECGVGAVVPFGGRLYWVTYPPHAPDGSDDLLHATDVGLEHAVWDGSVGGTHAARLVHRESRQLFLGPYVIGSDGAVRVVTPARMRGRLTAAARHLVTPSESVYIATMEEGLYEVDVETLEVTRLFADTHDRDAEPKADLPGYHGKGLASGQGVVAYANNGEYGRAALERPDVASGVLAEWSGDGPWRVVWRGQSTDVTGPGGIEGNARPDADPLWSIGWDHRSLVLHLRSARAPEGQDPWRRFRLPKASHAYDGAHGWNTEWPRIRDIGEEDLLMTMHGTLWRFPRGFDLGATGGIAPRSTLLKVVGDFAAWNGLVVLGCDDAARSEFLNTRRAKGEIAGPAESQSNLWFVSPDRLDALGPAIGRGGVFVGDEVEAGEWSDPFLFDGYDHRAVHLVHDADEPVRFRFEVDGGDGAWAEAGAPVEVPADGYRFHAFDPSLRGAWVRVAADRPCRATVWFEMRDRDGRGDECGAAFAALARAGESALGGLLRAGDRSRGLQLLATRSTEAGASATAYHELAPDLELAPAPAEGPERGAAWMQQNVAWPRGVVRIEGESALYVDDSGGRWRLPIGNPAFLEDPSLVDAQRAAREVTTERDLFQCAGTFFELPARNACGFARVRPIATHPCFVEDYASWRGLLALTGIAPERSARDPHVVMSEDATAAVWLGAVDDLWALGKPRGRVDPWSGAAVEPDVPSDPCLVAGYDAKTLHLSHDATEPVAFEVEFDVTGSGTWVTWATYDVPSGEEREVEFPAAFAAYWARVSVDRACSASATFEYR